MRKYSEWMEECRESSFAFDKTIPHDPELEALREENSGTFRIGTAGFPESGEALSEAVRTRINRSIVPVKKFEKTKTEILDESIPSFSGNNSIYLRFNAVHSTLRKALESLLSSFENWEQLDGKSIAEIFGSTENHNRAAQHLLLTMFSKGLYPAEFEYLKNIEITSETIIQDLFPDFPTQLKSFFKTDSPFLIKTVEDLSKSLCEKGLNPPTESQFFQVVLPLLFKAGYIKSSE